MKMKRIFTVITILVTLWIQASAERYYYFEHLNTTDGLPSNTIYCSLQDKSGFMWIGTRDGLCCYDGQNFVRLSEISSVHDMTGLVIAVTEDPSGALWFSSSDGIGYFNPMTDDARKIELPGGSMCWDVEADLKGNIWFAADMLFRYDTERSGMHTYSFRDSHPFMLAVDSLGTLWVLLNDGTIHTYDKLNDRFIQQNPSERIKLIEPVCGGRMLVATHTESVYLLDCISLSAKHVFYAPPRQESSV